MISPTEIKSVVKSHEKGLECGFLNQHDPDQKKEAHLYLTGL